MANQIKILAIDDKLDNLTIVDAIVYSQIPNAIVIKCNSGKAGINAAITQKPDVILLDIIMPDMDGYETCALLKQNDSTKHIPIIMLTAIRTDVESKVRALNMGADAFVTKPIEPAELIAQINVMLRIKTAEDKLRDTNVWLEDIVKERTEQIEESEQKYKALYENAPIPYQSLNAEGNILDVNPAWLNALGYKRDDVLNKWFGDLLHPEQRVFFVKSFVDLKYSGADNESEVQILHKNGSYRDVVFKSCAAYTHEGNFKQTYCVFQDVTEKRKAERALFESQAQLLAIYNAAINVSFITTNLKGADTTIESFSPGAEYIFGYTQQEIIGQKVLMLHMPNDEGSLQDLQLRLKREKSGIHMETRFLRKGGVEFPALFSLYPIFNAEGIMHGTLGVTIDISKRKQFEIELSESNRKQQTLLNNLQGAAYRCKNDPNWTMEYISAGFEEMFGYLPSEVENNKKYAFNDLILPDDRQMVHDIVQQAIANKSNFEAQYRVKTKNGEIKHVLDKGLGIFMNNKLLAIEGFITDITHKVESDQALMQSETLNRSITQTAVDAIITCDNNAKILTWNTAAEQIFGFSAHEMLNEALNRIVPNKYKENINQGFANIYISYQTLGKNKIVELSAIHKDGHEFPVELTLSQWHFNDSPFYTIIVRNIIERKRLEQIQQIVFRISNAVSQTDSLENLIQLIKKHLASVLNTTNFYIALTSDSHDSLQVPYHTSEFENFDFTDIDKHLCNYVIDSKAPLLLNHQNANTHFYEKKLQLPNEVKHWLGVPLIIIDKIIGVISLQSYTEHKGFSSSDLKILLFVSNQISLSINRKKTEENLKEALRKAKESDQLKSAFLANMSHEIRTPMNAVLGFSQIILNEEIDELEKPIFSEFIKTNGEILIKIIDDIMDISKIQSNLLKIEQSTFDLHKLFAELENYYNRILSKQKKQNVALIIKTESDLNRVFEIESDMVRLKQIINNLLSNAIKYTHEGTITLSYRVDNNKLFISVEDTGEGIPASKLNQIFDRFVQFSQRFISREEGTGLGLTISKELASLLGGELMVESTEGIGSTFSFYIPYKLMKSKLVEPIEDDEEAQQYNLSKNLILIVDDEESNYILTKRILQETGVKTQWAADGVEAVNACKDNDYDLVIMDIKMPRMDGIEATRQIKIFKPQLPIIIQTAFAMDDVKAQAVNAGCNDFITKPITIDNLIKILSTYLNKQ